LSVKENHLWHSGAITTRAVMFVITIAALASLLMVTPASAQATTDSYRFVPVRLTCIDFEDPWPDWRDETNFYYGDQVFFDYYPAGHKAYPPPTTFTGSSLKLELWELDNSWRDSDHLGTVYVTATDLGQEKTQTFSGPGWLYELVYKVEPA
jgi:hypothetical protein